MFSSSQQCLLTFCDLFRLCRCRHGSPQDGKLSLTNRFPWEERRWILLPHRLDLQDYHHQVQARNRIRRRDFGRTQSEDRHHHRWQHLEAGPEHRKEIRNHPRVRRVGVGRHLRIRRRFMQALVQNRQLDCSIIDQPSICTRTFCFIWTICTSHAFFLSQHRNTLPCWLNAISFLIQKPKH